MPADPGSSAGSAAFAEACAEVVGATHVLRSTEDMAPFASDFWRSTTAGPRSWSGPRRRARSPAWFASRAGTA